MKTFYALLAVCLVLMACQKDGRQTIFKGKYIGEGCESVIQFLEPVDERFKEVTFIFKDSIYTGCVFAAPVPEKYKTGEPFYFKMKRVTDNLAYPAICSTPSLLYKIEIEIYTETPPIAQ